MTQAGPQSIDRTIVHPLPPTKGTTHFKLRKGGSKGTECFHTDPRGVTVDKIPIEDFDKDTVTARWGHDADFAVQFFKETEPGKFAPMSTWKRFGILPDVAHAEEAPEVSLVPRTSGPAADMQGSLMALSLWKDIATKDTEVQVSAHRTYADAALQASRESATQNLQIMTTMMTAMMTMQRPPTPAIDPALTAVLAQLAEGQKKITELLGGEDDEDEDEEPTDYARYAKLVLDVKKHGMGALWDYAKEEGGMALVEALPTIRAKLPDIIPLLKPMVDRFFSQAMGGASAPAPPPQPQWSPPIMAQPQPRFVPPPAPPYAPPPPPPHAANGHASPAPAPAPQAPDGETAAVE